MTITASGKTRVLIVDDEAPARTKLRNALAAEKDFEIAGEAETAAPRSPP